MFFVFSEEPNLTISEVDTACDKGCDFTFTHHGNVYNGSCLIDGNVPTPFCITNEVVFNGEEDLYFENGTKTGWKECNGKCPNEKFCPKCELNYRYKEKYYNNCIYYDNQSGEENYQVIATLPWCIIDSTAFELNPYKGWSYCSDECHIETDLESIVVKASTELAVARLVTTEKATEQEFIYIIIILIVLIVLVSIPFSWLLYQRLVTDRNDHCPSKDVETKAEYDYRYSSKQSDEALVSLSETTRIHYIPKENNEIHSQKFERKNQFMVKTYEIERSEFTIGELLGKGNFGIVYKGELHEPSGYGKKKEIAIKIANASINDDSVKMLSYEIKIMAKIEYHINLVNMIATCIAEEEVSHKEVFLILEFCKYGNLKDFLIQNREKFTSEVSIDLDEEKIHISILILFAYDVAKGMEYLARHNIMHGDLAARNVLISEISESSGCLIAKISDFGLSKPFYGQMVYEKRDRRDIPWRWMAIEMFRDGLFTMNSDVWSYGVLIWEILSMGEQPYPGLSQNEVLDALRIGERLQCPKCTTQFEIWPLKEFYNELSELCFQENPLRRACFSQIIAIINRYIPGEELSDYRNISKSFSRQTSKNSNTTETSSYSQIVFE